jgi:DNA-binding response OmpR family regulator
MPARHPVLLIVEDDWTLRELYRLALSLSEFTVHACEDGIGALHYLDREQPDLVILDLNLPRIPGQMVYEELRARSQTGSVPPVIVVTGGYNVPYLPGATVLRKPVTAEMLRRTIVRVLERRREWLFVSGANSVRIIRIEDSSDCVRLLVRGPGDVSTVHDDRDAQTGFRRQQEIEHELAARGYRLLPFDRRSGRDRRVSSRERPDRRRLGDTTG